MMLRVWQKMKTSESINRLNLVLDESEELLFCSYRDPESVSWILLAETTLVMIFGNESDVVNKFHNITPEYDYLNCFCCDEYKADFVAEYQKSIKQKLDFLKRVKAHLEKQRN